MSSGSNSSSSSLTNMGEQTDDQERMAGGESNGTEHDRSFLRGARLPFFAGRANSVSEIEMKQARSNFLVMLCLGWSLSLSLS